MPNLLGREGNPERLAQLEALLGKSKKMLETYFLRDRRFICGDEISIADLQAVCELTQFWVAGADPSEGRPVIARWMDDVQATLQPHFDEVHNMVYMARDRSLQGKTMNYVVDKSVAHGAFLALKIGYIYRLKESRIHVCTFS